MLIIARSVNLEDKVKYYAKNKNCMIVDLENEYQDMSFNNLKTDDGYFLRNIWEFSKVFKVVPNLKQIDNTKEGSIIWGHRTEKHVDKDNRINRQFEIWRENGLKHPTPVIYGDDYDFFIDEDLDKYITLIEARRELLLKKYCKFIKYYPKFQKIKRAIDSGINVVIIDKDGPRQESLPYYMGRYGVVKNTIVDNSIVATKKNLNMMLNDPRHFFGAGYCLAWALKGFAEE